MNEGKEQNSQRILPACLPVGRSTPVALFFSLGSPHVATSGDPSRCHTCPYLGIFPPLFHLPAIPFPPNLPYPFCFEFCFLVKASKTILDLLGVSEGLLSPMFFRRVSGPSSVLPLTGGTVRGHRRPQLSLRGGAEETASGAVRAAIFSPAWTLPSKIERTPKEQRAPRQARGSRDRAHEAAPGVH